MYTSCKLRSWLATFKLQYYRIHIFNYTTQWNLIIYIFNTVARFGFIYIKHNYFENIFFEKNHKKHHLVAQTHHDGRYSTDSRGAKMTKSDDNLFILIQQYMKSPKTSTRVVAPFSLSTIKTTATAAGQRAIDRWWARVVRWRWASDSVQWNMYPRVFPRFACRFTLPWAGIERWDGAEPKPTNKKKQRV